MCTVIGGHVSNVFLKLWFLLPFFVSIFIVNVFIEETSLMSYKMYQGQHSAYCTAVMLCKTLLLKWCLELEFSLQVDLNIFRKCFIGGIVYFH